MPAPLAGVRVLDVSRFVSGPLCTFLLASMGAEVISVESPRTSTSRRLPPFAHPDGGSTREYVDGAMSVPFLKRGRGKRSVAIALGTDEGVALVRRLAFALLRRSTIWVNSSVTPSATARAPAATATRTPVTSPVRDLMPTFFPVSV